MWIGKRIPAFECCHFQWPSITLTYISRSQSHYLTLNTSLYEIQIQLQRNTNGDLTPFSTVSFRMTLTDLTKYSMTGSIARSHYNSWTSCFVSNARRYFVNFPTTDFHHQDFIFCQKHLKQAFFYVFFTHIHLMRCLLSMVSLVAVTTFLLTSDLRRCCLKFSFILVIFSKKTKMRVFFWTKCIVAIVDLELLAVLFQFFLILSPLIYSVESRLLD